VRKLTTVLLISVGCVIQTGCTSSTPPFEPIIIRDGSVEERVPLKFVAGEKVTLPKAIEIALENNPNLESIRMNIAKARANFVQAQSTNGFKLDAIGSASMFTDSQRVLPPSANGEPGEFAKNMLGAELVLSYPLFNGGKFSALEDAAQFSVNARKQVYLRSRQEMEFNITRAFVQVLTYRSYLKSLQFNYTSLEQHLVHINNLIKAQKAADIERLRVEVRLADLKQNVTKTRNELELSRQLLANLMGMDDAVFEVTGELSNLTTGVELGDAQKMLQDAELFRSDLNGMKEQLKGQAKLVDAAKGESDPQVSAFAAYGGQWGIDPEDSPSDYDRNDGVGRIGLTLTIPIWDGHLSDAKIQESEAERARLQLQYASLKKRIGLEVRTALLNIHSTDERIIATQTAQDQAAEVLRVQQESQKLGKSTVTDVLDAQSALLTAQTNYQTAIAESKIAHAELKLAIGKESKK